MNDTHIEKLLRQAPRPAAPAGLRDQLEAGIMLPPPVSPGRENSTWAGPVWRRWFPALAFGVVLLSCCLLVAVQTSQIVKLRRENEALRAAAAEQRQLRQQHARMQQLAAQTQELDRLRRDEAELLQLRAEASQLREKIPEFTALQAENQRLRAEFAAKQALAAAPNLAEEDPFAEAKAKAQRIACLNNLKQIGLAARLWANDNKDVLPEDFLSMTNELSTPKVLFCPADTHRQRSSTWAEFTAQNLSYELISPGVEDKYPDVVFTRCPIHHSVLLTDGSAHHLGPSDRIVDVDGRKKISRGTPEATKAKAAP